MLHFICNEFKALNLEEFYDIMALRQSVFVVEQNCPYLDADGQDKKALHVLGKDDKGALQGYARIFAAGEIYDGFVAIGRICTNASIRSTGQGKRLIKFCLKECSKRFPNLPIKISAQCYLLKFYQSFGFEPVGDEYLEDDIPHHAMIWKEK